MAGGAGAAAVPLLAQQARALPPAAQAEYGWYLYPDELIVPSGTWTTIPFKDGFHGSGGHAVINETDITPATTDGVFEVPASASGFYNVLGQVAWENVFGVDVHRRMVRQSAYFWGEERGAVTAEVPSAPIKALIHPTEGPYSHPENAIPQQHQIANGAYWEVGANDPPEEFKIQVWQNSGQPIKLVPTALESQSITWIKIAEKALATP